MENLTWVGVVAVLLLVSQLINLFNSTATAKKNASAPLEAVRADVSKNKEAISDMKHDIANLKRDVDNAHSKIRETESKLERTTKAQNKAFMALLFWAKTNGQDASKIDEAIDEISEL